MHSHVGVAFDLIWELERLAQELGAMEHTTTVTSISPAGGVITLDDALPIVDGAYTAYRNAVIEVINSDSPAFRMRCVIATVEGGGVTVRLQDQFPSRRQVAVGDTVRISGGPLSLASVYFSEPDSIGDEVSQGFKFFVTVTPNGGSMGPRGGGDAVLTRRQNVQKVLNEYQYTVTAETFLTTQTGEDTTYVSPTTEGAARALLDSPTLLLQCAYVINAFRFDAKNGIVGTDDIEWVDKIFARPGGHIMKAAEISFNTTMH